MQKNCLDPPLGALRTMPLKQTGPQFSSFEMFGLGNHQYEWRSPGATTSLKLRSRWARKLKRAGIGSYTSFFFVPSYRQEARRNERHEEIEEMGRWVDLART